MMNGSKKFGAKCLSIAAKITLMIAGFFLIAEQSSEAAGRVMVQRLRGLTALIQRLNPQSAVIPDLNTYIGTLSRLPRPSLDTYGMETAIKHKKR